MAHMFDCPTMKTNWLSGSMFERFLLIMSGTILSSHLLIPFKTEIGLNDDVVSTYFFARFRD